MGVTTPGCASSSCHPGVMVSCCQISLCIKRQRSVLPTWRDLNRSFVACYRVQCSLIC